MKMRLSVSERINTARPNTGEVVRKALLRQLNTTKKEYFVLRGDSAESSACLECYEGKNRFKNNALPNRVIELKTCFNIDQLLNEVGFVIGLYCREECFCLVFDKKEELDEWLAALLTLQHGKHLPAGEPVKPFFDHVWKAEVIERKLAAKLGMQGSYHICLKNRDITLIKASSDDSNSTINFSVDKLRSFSSLSRIVRMELGDDAVTGAGELCMTTQDSDVADSMHATINKMMNLN